MVVQQQAAATGAVSALARRAVLVMVALTIATATGVATPLVLNMITGYAEGEHLLFDSVECRRQEDARHRTKVNDLGITAGLAAQVLQQGKEPRRGLPCHPAPLNGWRGCRNACGQYACHRRCTTASCTAWKQAREIESTQCGQNS